ncbi:MAG TPA: histidine kinase, partial [Thermoanaerobaculia bacterium]|nr:histidine kinase [Thermoanaerobaculia bacterium]
NQQHSNTATQQPKVTSGARAVASGAPAARPPRIIERTMNRRVVLLALLAWTLVALYFATQAYFNPAYEERPRWSDAVAVNLTYYWLWGLTAPLVTLLARRFPLRSVRNAGVHVAASILLTAVQLVVAETILWNFVGSVYRRHTPFWESLSMAFGVNFHSSLPTYWVILAAYLAWTYARNTSRLETQLAHAQLDALKMQLNPHFLFNTLNSVSALMYVDVDAADAMLTRLSDFLRTTLERPIAQEIPLSEEIAFVQRYLEIERMRFEERLRVNVDVAAGTEDALVPALILQPLVENAIHHGIARRPDGGAIGIRALRRDDMLHLVVTDDVDGTPDVRERVGLSNTRARLQALYGSRHELRYGPTNFGFAVEIAIPCSAP